MNLDASIIKRSEIWPSELDKNSPIPLYYQIEYILEREIRNGNFKQREKLPTEHDLVKIFSVSRSVIRQAIKGLLDKGMVWRSPGKGTFVAERKFSFQTLRGFPGFFQAVESAGSLPKSKLLEKKTMKVSGKIAKALQVPDDSSVFFINRLRFIDDEPFLLSRTYLPLDRIPMQLLGEDLENQSLYALLEEKYKYELGHSQRAIEAIQANKEEAKLLTIKPGDILIRTRTITSYISGEPFEYDIGLHRGDRTRFEIRISRDSDEKLQLHLTN